MFDCQVCSRRLSLREIIHCMKRRGELSYPHRAISGSRVDHPHRWMCHDCLQRAARRREEEEGEEAGPAPSG